MVNNGMSVKIDTRGMERKMAMVMQLYPEGIRSGIKRLADVTERRMRTESPVASGKLRASIVSEFRENGFVAEVKPTASHAKYVVTDTKASPGRYVPAIGKRLVNPPSGMHPGTKANDFVGRAREYVIGMSMNIMETEINLALATVRT